MLSLAYERDSEDTTGGVLVSGSSDTTAKVWRVRLKAGGDEGEVEKLATLKGCDLGVLSVALSPTKIILS